MTIAPPSLKRLLASLDELSEEEAERLWAKEAQRRREEFAAESAVAIKARGGGGEGGKVVPVTPVRYHQAA